MPNNRLMRFILLSLGLTVILSVFAIAGEGEGKDKGKQLAKTGALAPELQYKVLNINNLSTWMRNTGLSNHSPDGDNGMYYPRGTKWLIYEDGLMWGGKVHRDAGLTTGGPFSQTIRVGGSHYRSGTVNGWINGTGSSGTAQDQNDPLTRAYRVRRDYKVIPESELIRDASELFEVPLAEVTSSQTAAVLDYYNKDWNDWALMVPRGAPFIDRNGNGVYDAPPAFNYNAALGTLFTHDSLITQGKDEPGVAGSDPNSPADQVIWCVFNDLTRTATTALNGAEPMGLEIQATVWGYKRTDALGNLYFKRYRVINKGGVDTSDVTGNQAGSFWVDSMFVAQWSDPDLGNAGDDVIGCDSVLGLGFIYNGVPVDNEYRKVNLAPPSAGYDFLQGPRVVAPGDSGVFGLKRIYGYRNLPMSAFTWFAASAAYSDPGSQYTTGALYWWKMFRGYVPLAGPDVLYPLPPGYPSTPFSLAGDPVAGTGHLDGQGTSWSFIPGDRRIIMTAGPFSMSPGDTQEVVMGTVAGVGADRISSVAVMRFNDRFVQNTYNDLFVVPKAPARPDVKYSELDGEIVIEWGSNLVRVRDTENTTNNPGAYIFEGYNVYQLPSAGSPFADWVRVATYDLPTDPAVITDEQADPSGVILFKPVQFGTNSGLTRYISLKRDYVRDIDKLYNGQEYYYAVTAYSRTTTGYLPATLESSPLILTLRPQSPKPGVVYSTESGSGLTIGHPVGIGDVPIDVTVIDPSQVNGQSYTIGWSGQPDKFAGSTQDDPDVPTWIFTATATLNAAATSFSYNVDVSNVANLAGPVSGIYFDTTGTYGAFKNLPYTVVLGNAHADGSWTTTDGTQPLTAPLRQAITGGNLYCTIITSVDTIQIQVAITNYPYYINRGSTTLFTYQQNYSQDNTYPVFDGLQAKVGNPVWSLPTSYSLEQTAGTGDGMLSYDGFGVMYSDIFPQSTNTTTQTDMVTDLEFRFTGVRVSEAAADTVIVSGGSIATVASSNAASIVRIRIPFELWEVDQGTGRSRQINVVCRDRNADAKSPWGSGGAPLYIRMSTVGARAYIGAVSTPYNSDAGAAGLAAVPRDNPQGTWFFAPGVTAGTTPVWKTGDVTHVSIANPSVPSTELFTFTAPAPVAFSTTAAKEAVQKVGVFPNPYYGFNPAETNRFNRFVTFNFLPDRATIRIFNLAGQLVKTLEKDPGQNPGQFMRWNLTNQYNFPVASGIYLVHIDMPDQGTSKVLKVAIIMEQEVLDVF